MKVKLLIAITGALFFASCASEKAMTTVESVQGAQDSVDKTNDFISRAETTITDFEKSINTLLKESATSEQMRGKAKYHEALTTMDRKIAESRRDLAHLKATNTESWEAYKGVLKSAKDDMHDTFKSDGK
jgi:PBP1b-binding outer membrane lipoprotein LpoB